MVKLLTIAAVSYLLGSIPFGYLLVRIFRGEDVRKSGSGNIGATNVSRKSPALGVATLLLDALKGTTAVALSYPPWMDLKLAESQNAWPFTLMAMAALFAVLGHMFPVWLKFRGGKGVATGLGAFVIMAPKAVLICAAIFLVVVSASRYVSLASILAVAAFPIAVCEIYPWGRERVILALISATSLLIIFKHHENIHRLLAGTESRFGAKRA
jgi:acyl phosphate:glycerol-3-phosphate acyltransferase